MNRKPVKSTDFTVKEPAELMTFLMEQLAGISRSKVKTMLSNRLVLVNDIVRTQFNYPLSVGQIVSINRDKRIHAFKSNELEIVYEDAYLIVINKHHGLLSMGKPGLHTAQEVLNSYFNQSGERCRAHLVHRLDRETSGLMLYAKDIRTQQAFIEHWKETVTDRRYVALVTGMMEQESGTVQSYLKDNKMYVTFSSPTDNGGKLAITHFRTIKSNPDYSLVELKLETGRKNQIRVHMQDLGHPIVGDLKYGSNDDIIDRLALHAFKLCFYHPVTGELLQFETPYPRVFKGVMNQKNKT